MNKLIFFKKFLFLILLSIFMILGISNKASASSLLPRPTSGNLYYQDTANMFNEDTKNYISNKAISFNNEYNNTIGVVTIDKLPGLYSIESYSTDLFNK